MLQRRMRIGYTRAARIVDALEEKGIIGPSQAGVAVRQVLDYGPVAPPEDADLS
jgi:DNA segregation ATPase FtsK/SpoIIIE, S-DNA-T family